MRLENINKNTGRITRFIFETIWNISERTGIGLGRFGPCVVGKIIGSKGTKITDKK